MNIEYHKWFSPMLGRDMELKVYGHWGKSFIIFPTLAGRFFQAEDEGIIHTVEDKIEQGKMNIITVDSIDNEAWSNQHIHPHDRGNRHTQYERYILKEVLPFINNRFNNSELKPGCAGFSMGGYHAANFFFKHPQLFDVVIAISGFYDLKLLVGDNNDDLVYFNSPNRFLKNLSDPVILDNIKNSKIVICSGQGSWEEEMFESTVELKNILEGKSIPAWIDIWGKDVNHDWPWWRKMFPYFISHMDL